MKNKLHSDLYNQYLKKKQQYRHYQKSQELTREELIEWDSDPFTTTPKHVICAEIHENKWMLRSLQQELIDLKYLIKQSQTKYNRKYS